MSLGDFTSLDRLTSDLRKLASAPHADIDELEGFAQAYDFNGLEQFARRLERIGRSGAA